MEGRRYTGKSANFPTLLSAQISQELPGYPCDIAAFLTCQATLSDRAPVGVVQGSRRPGPIVPARDDGRAHEWIVWPRREIAMHDVAGRGLTRNLSF